jgi:hypothetical protein
MCPSCQSPYISLPMDHQRTLNGACCPLSARCAPMGVDAAPFAYSTCAAAEAASPRPLFTAM